MARSSGLSDNITQKIVNVIYSRGKEGISKKEVLQKLYPVDQSTVWLITKNLEAKGIIKIIRQGQRATYFAVDGFSRNVGLCAYLLGSSFIGDYTLLGKKGLVLDYPATVKSPFEKTIFEYSNQIGAFITYLFIHALNEDNINALLSLQRELKGKDKKDKNSIKLVTEEWIRNSICFDVMHMFWKFNHMLKSLALTRQGKKGKEQLLERKSINELLKAFSRVYPKLYDELELLRTDLEQHIILHKNRVQTAQEELDKQNTCSHEFTPPKELAVRDDKRRKRMIQICVKCGQKKIYEKQSWS
jgi:hypothetical protein